ncbi:DUF1761 family protein [Agrobacterium pusense]|jgi:hypothetical protein|uniref:DUF1761 family protein n=1 Tax=Agrobacterium pusense TaxID=648995 RepID=UPI000C2D0D41|nr:DUF1761 family protein [Agrobacterium pusense]AUC12262.1 hypothetical protein BLX90_18450 [Rhizobium sp. Y9]MCZ7930086.1 DUF1761 family protein [Agrobacterium pusense]MDP9772069.1 hypothetical protein [Rhizobium sp. SORGH_AS_0755]PTV74130.1 DUF1761 domain-containing protein [Agrobacterium pusense]
MLSTFAQLPWIGVLAGTFAFFFLGGVYFGVLVPKQYIYVTGREKLPQEQLKPMTPIFFVGPLICSFITVIADAFLIQALGVTDIADATTLGSLIGLGFLVPMIFNIAINPLFPRPLQYGMLNAPYFLTANVIACLLLVTIPW